MDYYNISYKSTNNRRSTTGVISRKYVGSSSGVGLATPVEVRLQLVNRYGSRKIDKKIRQFFDELLLLTNKYFDLTDTTTGSNVTKRNRGYSKNIIKKGELELERDTLRASGGKNNGMEENL